MVPEWALAGFESGPLDPHFPPGSLEITASHLPEGKQLHSPSLWAWVTQWVPVRARGGTGALSLWSCCASFHPCPSPSWASPKPWGSWSSLWVRSYEEDLHGEKGLRGSWAWAGEGPFWARNWKGRLVTS